MNKDQIEEIRKAQVPAGAIKVTSKKSPTVVYLYERNGTPCMKGFAGNARNPAASYYFGAVEKRSAYVAQFMSEQDANFAYRENRKAERKAKLAEQQTALKVGDVLMSMWGYEQTNVDYYEVIELKGKRGVVIRQIGCESEDSELFMQGKSVPVKGAYIGEPMLKQVNEYGSVRIASYASASKLEPVAVVAGKEIFPATSWTAYA